MQAGMSAHLNITSTISTVYGVTLGTGAEADDCQKTQTVEIAELMGDADGEIALADPVNHVQIECTVSGDGPLGLSISPGTVADPTTLTVISKEVSEAPNQRCTFSARATAHDSFTDPDTSITSVGAEPAIADLEITSVEYSVAESVRRSAEVSDMVLVGTDGTPAHRATVTLRNPFSIQGRGDLPAGVGLGTGGANFAGATTGKVVVGTLTEGEKRADWNRWSVDGNQYQSAS